MQFVLNYMYELGSHKNKHGVSVAQNAVNTRCHRSPSSSHTPALLTSNFYSLILSILLTSLSTFLTRPSHSTQHLICPLTSISCHLTTTPALRRRSSETLRSCSACFLAARSIRGHSDIRCVNEDVGGGGARSERARRPETVDCKVGAAERTMVSACVCVCVSAESGGLCPERDRI